MLKVFGLNVTRWLSCAWHPLSRDPRAAPPVHRAATSPLPRSHRMTPVPPSSCDDGTVWDSSPSFPDNVQTLLTIASMRFVYALYMHMQMQSTLAQSVPALANAGHVKVQRRGESFSDAAGHACAGTFPIHPAPARAPGTGTAYTAATIFSASLVAFKISSEAALAILGST